MKMIVAVIKPSRLDAVLEAVTEAGASGLTVTEVRGYGRQKGKTEVYRGAEYEVKLLPKVKLEIAVSQDMVDKVVEGGTAPRAGYQHVEWDVLMKNTMFGDARLALIWSNANELVSYFSGLLTPPEAEVDAVVNQRSTHNNTASVAQG